MCSLDEGIVGEYWSQTGHLDVVEELLQAPWRKRESRDRVPLSLTRPVPVHDYNLRLDWLDNIQPGCQP